MDPELRTLQVLYSASLLTLEQNTGTTVLDSTAPHVPSLSFAVSIKMNIILFAPALLALLVLSLGWRGALPQLALCGLVQVGWNLCVACVPRRMTVACFLLTSPASAP